MSSECDALRNEINRLRQDIAGLDSRFIPRRDRPQIINDALTNFRSIFPALFLGAFIPAIGPFAERLTDTELAASLAQNVARAADGRSVQAISESALAKNVSLQAKVLGEANRAKISTVEGIATGAKNLAQTAEGAASAANAAVRTLDGKVARVAGQAGDALRTAANAVGISNRALGFAGQALRGLFRALALIDILFGILAALTIASQLAAIINRLNIIERTLAPIYGLIGVNRSKADAAAAAAERAYQKALQAGNAASQAQSTAGSAQQSANSALDLALRTFSVVASLLFLRSLVPRIQTIAQQAQGTATTALQRADQALQRSPLPGRIGAPGAPGAPGRIGLRGAPGAPGARGDRGAPGFPGLRGAPGFFGRTGRTGATGAPGVRGVRGPQGLKGSDGEMNPIDSALLRKIDATTTADLAVNRQNQTLIQSSRASILAYLVTMQTFAATAWKNSRINKLINLLTLISVVHNVGMLSREVGESIADLASNALAVVGVKDEEGNQLDINELVGTSVTSFFENLLGAEVYADLSVRWQKANRIVSSAAMIAYTVRGLHDTSKDILEWTAENTGKIGNALKRWGIVGERAYPWMSERVKSQDAYRRKFERVTEGLESLEDTASSFSQVTGNVREIQEEFTELQEQKAAFTELVSVTAPEITATAAPENAAIAAVELQAKLDNDAPPISLSNAARGD